MSLKEIFTDNLINIASTIITSPFHRRSCQAESSWEANVFTDKRLYIIYHVEYSS